MQKNYRFSENQEGTFLIADLKVDLKICRFADLKVKFDSSKKHPHTNRKYNFRLLLGGFLDVTY